MSVGTAGSEREMITNVASRTAAIDAVNVSQLNDILESAERYTNDRVDTL